MTKREDEIPTAKVERNLLSLLCNCYTNLLLPQTRYCDALPNILPEEVKCYVQAITRVIEAQDQLVESAKLGTDKPTAAKS